MTSVPSTNEAPAGTVFTMNQGNGIEIRGQNATSNIIAGAYLVGNAQSGVLIDNAPGNQVGKAATNEESHMVRFYFTTIASNRSGVCIVGAQARNNAVMEASFWEQDQDAIVIDNAPHNVIGALKSEHLQWQSFQIIQGNDGYGIRISGAEARQNHVRNYWISDGILIDGAPENIIGGVEEDAGNRIEHGGVHLRGEQATRNQLLRNTISLVSGQPGGSLPAAGILIENAPTNFVGGMRGAGNLLELNRGHGIVVLGSRAEGNQLEFNEIRSNDGHGVHLVGGAGNCIGENAIHDNQGLGINLVGGDSDSLPVTPNDASDSDTGPNQLQNFPDIQAAEWFDKDVYLKGFLSSSPTKRYTLRFFANPAADPSGFGEGAASILSQIVETDGRGTASFLLKLPGSALQTNKTFVTATATDELGNTSEFSRAFEITPGKDTDGDGMPDLAESSGPQNGDANQDGLLDVEQKYVVSAPVPRHLNDYLILVSEPTTTLGKTRLRTILEDIPEPPPAGVEFPLGILSLEARPQEGKTVKIKMIPPPGIKVNSYWKHGPTPNNPTPHWYRFLHNGRQGLVVGDNLLELYIVDGEIGDYDLRENNVIIDPGAPAFEPELRLRDVRRRGDGQVQFTLEGRAGQDYRILASTNLLDWVELLTTNAPSDTLEIIDTQAPAVRQRFYRAGQAP